MRGAFRLCARHRSHKLMESAIHCGCLKPSFEPRNRRKCADFEPFSLHFGIEPCRKGHLGPPLGALKKVCSPKIRSIDFNSNSAGREAAPRISPHPSSGHSGCLTSRVHENPCFRCLKESLNGSKSMEKQLSKRLILLIHSIHGRAEHRHRRHLPEHGSESI